MEKYMDPLGKQRLHDLEVHLSAISRPFIGDFLIQKTEKVVGYKIETWPMDISNLSWQGKVFPKKDRLVICVNKNLSPAGQHFVVGHEIAHVIHSFSYNDYFGRPRERSFIPGSSRYSSLEEEICDYIALRILCPEQEIRELVPKYYSSCQASLSIGTLEGVVLFSLAKQFNVPVKEIGLWIKQIASGRTLGISSKKYVVPIPSVKESIKKLALTQ